MQVMGRPRGATLILPHCRDGPSRGWHRIMRVLLRATVQESMGNLTRDHYLNSPPIELSLTEFSHTRKIPSLSGRDSNPHLRAQRQARNPLSHPTTLQFAVLSVFVVIRSIRFYSDLHNFHYC